MEQLQQRLGRLLGENATLDQWLETLAEQQAQQEQRMAAQPVHIGPGLLNRLVDLPDEMAAAMRSP